MKFDFAHCLLSGRGLALLAIFAAASVVFGIWSVLEAQDAATAAGERLEQRLTAIERTLAEMQDERRP